MPSLLHAAGCAGGPSARQRPVQLVRQDEVCGPVSVVEAFDSFDEAPVLYGAGRFGLQVGIFTRNVNRALRASRDLNHGGVWIKALPTFRVDSMPYTGAKDTGFGREGLSTAWLSECCMQLWMYSMASGSISWRPFIHG